MAVTKWITITNIDGELLCLKEIHWFQLLMLAKAANMITIIKTSRQDQIYIGFETIQGAKDFINKDKLEYITSIGHQFTSLIDDFIRDSDDDFIFCTKYEQENVNKIDQHYYPFRPCHAFNTTDNSCIHHHQSAGIIIKYHECPVCGSEHPIKHCESTFIDNMLC